MRTVYEYLNRTQLKPPLTAEDDTPIEIAADGTNKTLIMEISGIADATTSTVVIQYGGEDYIVYPVGIAPFRFMPMIAPAGKDVDVAVYMPDVSSGLLNVCYTKTNS